MSVFSMSCLTNAGSIGFILLRGRKAIIVQVCCSSSCVVSRAFKDAAYGSSFSALYCQRMRLIEGSYTTPTVARVAFPDIVNTCSRSSALYTHHPRALLPKACNTFTIFQNPSTIHMPFTVVPFASPPAHFPSLLKHIAPLSTAVSLIDMITPHIGREPCTDELDGPGRHVAKMPQLEAVVVGVRGVVIRRSDGVCCGDIGCGRTWACEDGG